MMLSVKESEVFSALGALVNLLIRDPCSLFESCILMIFHEFFDKALIIHGFSMHQRDILLCISVIFATVPPLGVGSCAFVTRVIPLRRRVELH
jgi:hypothetical protein